ncbi:hypothetical protein L873DRAFT_1663995, partial [Choiromyces venosus 120613-1]
LWMDESTFSMAGFGHHLLVLYRLKEDFHPDCIDETWESGRESIMVWGEFCGEMKLELNIIPPKIKVDSWYYVTYILDPVLILFWHLTCEHYGCTQVSPLITLNYRSYTKSRDGNRWLKMALQAIRSSQNTAKI